MLMTFLQFYSCLILFIAMTNENSSFAKISLYSFEFLLIIFLSPSNLPKNDLSQICAGICIYLLLIYIYLIFNWLKQKIKNIIKFKRQNIQTKYFIYEIIFNKINKIDNI